MAIGGISTGINSGLPIGDLVTAMVNAEKAPKQAQLDRLSKSTETKFSSLGELNGALNTFQAAMKDLNSPELFEKRTANSSNKEALTATAGKTAAAGTYSIEVKNLATSSKVATAVVDKDFKSADSASSLSVKVGEGPALTVDIAANSDLASIRDQINTQLKDEGITANIIKDPSTGDSRLVLSSNETGEGNDISVSGQGVLSALDVDGSVEMDASKPAGGGAGFITQARDATFSIDGLTLKSPTNKVTDAISDVSFDLLAVTDANKPLTLKVGQDTAGVTTSVKKFVDAYNALITTSNKLTNVTKVGEDGAPVVGGLVGDATVRGLLSSVRNELVSPGGQGGDLKFLADMGITTQKDGTLKIDDAKLDTALKDNFDSVAKLFVGDEGLMKRLDSKVVGYTETGGIIQQRQKALEATRSDITKQREDLERRVASMQTRLLAQFNAMESLVGQLNGTSSQLESALGNLPGVVRNNK
ncbi:flagellar filament capping protein FliD [Pseudomonas fulva]|uniref:Flagellar hook-associated protein 2 n=1 Tax=Pseudomonas fulva (strain 12-X) TaxID=743720 RepID=F6A8I6_PSEF1|nr:flagellar filament capping protein FliD [Pseudomonas fulva]AEF23057.1 flagellar hook-associated 2 domain-containing protein [Pseudomonas fulva 12-X]